MPKVSKPEKRDSLCKCCDTWVTKWTECRHRQGGAPGRIRASKLSLRAKATMKTVAKSIENTLQFAKKVTGSVKKGIRDEFQGRSTVGYEQLPEKSWPSGREGLSTENTRADHVDVKMNEPWSEQDDDVRIKEAITAAYTTNRASGQQAIVENVTDDEESEQMDDGEELESSDFGSNFQVDSDDEDFEAAWGVPWDEFGMLR